MSNKISIMSVNNIYLKSFVSGFLYVFGLSENPISYFENKYRKQNDKEEMKKDWMNIVNDIRMSYDIYNRQFYNNQNCKNINNQLD